MRVGTVRAEGTEDDFLSGGCVWSWVHTRHMSYLME